MSNEMEHTRQILEYMNEHYPILIAVATALSGGLVWVKRKVLNDVYATKEEMLACRASLADRLDAHEYEERRQFEKMQGHMQDNHDEIKDLVIEILAEKKDRGG